MPKLIVDGVTCRKRGDTQIVEFNVGHVWLTCGEIAKLGNVTEPAVRARAVNGLRGEALLMPAHDRPVEPEQRSELTEEQVETVRGLRKTRAMSDAQIATMMGVSVAYILNIKPTRGVSSETPVFDVGDGRMLRVAQIAAEAGTSRGTIYARIDRGVRGAALLLGQHKIGRGRKTAPMPAADDMQQGLDQAGQSASPSFVFEDDDDE